MTPATYVQILKRHGRRVANRACAADSDATGTLSEFYACYASEDELPNSERCRTGLISQFDPAGWFAPYANPNWYTHPEPALGEATAEDDAAAAAESVLSAAKSGEPMPTVMPSADQRLAADIRDAAHQIVTTAAAIESETEREATGIQLLNQHSERIATKYKRDSDAVFKAIIEAANHVSDTPT